MMMMMMVMALRELYLIECIGHPFEALTNAVHFLTDCTLVHPD